MSIPLCLAGATGWGGFALAQALAKTADIRTISAVSRTHAQRNLGEVLCEPLLDSRIYATAEEALAHPCDVFFKYTKPDIAKSNVLAALRYGAHVVIGTSGLTDEDYAEIATAAKQQQRGVLAVGNFALTVVLLQNSPNSPRGTSLSGRSSTMPATANKDAPSGTVRELVNRLSTVRPSELTVPLDQTQGIVETRGARMNGSQVHSIRLPSYAISAEIIFAMPDKKLSIRHDSGRSAHPYIDGALLAIRKVSTFTGLRRGLDTVLEL